MPDQKNACGTCGFEKDRSRGALLLESSNTIGYDAYRMSRLTCKGCSNLVDYEARTTKSGNKIATVFYRTFKGAGSYFAKVEDKLREEGYQIVSLREYDRGREAVKL